MKKIIILGVVCFFVIGSIYYSQQANYKNLDDNHNKEIVNLTNEVNQLYKDGNYDLALKKMKKIEEYVLLDKKNEIENKNRVDKFSYRSFAFVNIGIVILIVVLFYNIKKR